MRVLIVKMSAVGDVVHTLPVIDYLRGCGAEVDWVVEKSSEDLLQAHPHLGRVLLADVKRWRKTLFKVSTWREVKLFLSQLRGVKYDLLFDFQGNSKSAFVTYFAEAKVKVGFGWKTLAEKLNYFVTDQRYEVSRSVGVRSRYLGLVQAYFKDKKAWLFQPLVLKLQKEEQALLDQLLSHPLMLARPRWMIAFGSHWENKRLSGEQLQLFLKAIHKKYGAHFFFPYGNEEEKRVAEELQALFPEHSLVIGKLPLSVWQAFIAEIEGVIAMDSAALHLCGTTKTASFSLFGPSSAAVFKPEGEQHGAFQGSCPYGRLFEERCPVLRSCPTGACLREASPENLFSQFDFWWRSCSKLI